MPIKAMTPDVYTVDDAIVGVSREDCRFLIDQVASSERRRMRICAHSDTADELQEMFISFTVDSYLRPSYHNKDESIHILEGQAAYVFFDEAGAVTKVIQLGAATEAGRQFYCRIPQGVYHALVVQSDELLVHEITEGPFRREDTVFAPWAPDEDDTEAMTGYLEWLREVASPVESAG